MNKPGPWLFETPITLEAGLLVNSFSNSECESRWEASPGALGLGETEWESANALRMPRRPTVIQQRRQATKRQTTPASKKLSQDSDSKTGTPGTLIATIDRFEFGSYLLKKHQFEQISDLIEKLEALEAAKTLTKLTFSGHTDSSGGESKSNFVLSAYRALEVERFVQRTFRASSPNLKTRILIKSIKEPIASNRTEDGRSQNRRVEVFSEIPSQTP